MDCFQSAKVTKFFPLKKLLYGTNFTFNKMSRSESMHRVLTSCVYSVSHDPKLIHWNYSYKKISTVNDLSQPFLQLSVYIL